LKAFTTWSPYEKKDPAMKRSFGAVTAGKGASYAWEGNKEVGQGSMEIVASGPRQVLIKLDFLKPFEAHNMAEFGLEPRGDGTSVTWAIYGPS
ncbi:SRPBCC family protein, partial [Salmonella sp. SAL4448]|uniref:SRPBCC family protein n=1 Tax=Salmonella sp. SAL4448 TaxID=3159903 RepID=UPI00397DCE41